MSPLALLLVLGAACAHAGWNVLAHGTSRLGVPFLSCGAVASTLLWAIVAPLTGGLGEADLAGFLWAERQEHAQRDGRGAEARR